MHAAPVAVPAAGAALAAGMGPCVGSAGGLPVPPGSCPAGTVAFQQRSSARQGVDQGSSRHRKQDSVSTSASSTSSDDGSTSGPEVKVHCFADTIGEQQAPVCPAPHCCVTDLGVRIEEPDRQVLVTALAHVLTHLASLGHRQQRFTCFHAVRVPRLSVHEYLSRVATYFHCSDQCLVLSLVYIDRIVKLRPEFVVSTLSIHRLLMTSVMVAAKFWDDVFYSNAHYAKVGGVTASECSALEAQFLKLINWRLHVLPQEYATYLNQVLVAAWGQDGCHSLKCDNDQCDNDQSRPAILTAQAHRVEPAAPAPAAEPGRRERGQDPETEPKPRGADPPAPPAIAEGGQAASAPAATPVAAGPGTAVAAAMARRATRPSAAGARSPVAARGGRNRLRHQLR